ncbi:MAG TPA: (2Fe-2S)-binding protein [Kiloniellales bacterium]|jgi:predicted molibdopterin-dependent oxidoreductase YjgC|nr:(2Fe-2S)-binding protein [Kiloniellales bacterium]
MSFRRSDTGGTNVRFTFEGRPLEAKEGETLAAALLAAGVREFRHTPASNQPRGPFCMMGICFECLVEVDSRANQQACMLNVRPGMVVRLQRGARDPEA